ncbi:pilus assembly protein TadG-related protein [Nocardiopsis rhodophaea]
MTFRSPRRRAGEEGQASLFLLLGLMFSLLAIMLLFARLGNANDLRSQAQTAADSAALAAVGDTQDRMAKSLAAGNMVHFASWNKGTGEAAARRYAKENSAVVTDIRASDNMYGFSGNHVRVTVRGARCQRELEENRGRHWNDTPCKGNEKEKDIDTFSGEAAAIARIDSPINCSIAPGVWDKGRVQCDGKVIRSEADARSVINVQLVDQEGRWLYEGFDLIDVGNHPEAGGPMGNCDAPGAGTVTPLMCATYKATLAQFPQYMATGSACYRSNGGIPGGGEHPKGRACDMMVNNTGTVASGEQLALGDATAAWMQQNAEKLGVMYIIWKQRIWSPVRASEGWRPMNDRGSPTQNHWDHVHISVVG